MTKFAKILWGGVIGLTLTACTTDSVFEDNGQASTSEHPSNPGSQYATYSMSDSYESPWDIDSLYKVKYELYSGTMNDGVHVRVTPYIGLAYYDGANDGFYNTPTGGFNLASGAYPNLFASGNEYGDYVQANPIVLTQVPGTGWYTHELWVQHDEDHCPLVNIPVGINYNLNSIGFDIINNDIVQPMQLGYPLPAPPPAGTSAEERLLREYGKVFYYKVEFGTDMYNFDPDAYYVLALENNSINDDWSLMGLSDVPFGSDLLYHDSPSGVSTKEIVVNPDTFTGSDPMNVSSGQLFGTATLGSGTGIRKITTVPFYDEWVQIPALTGPWVPKPNRQPRGVKIYIE
ncbi:hypothetical protein MG290_11025 [Flavobacterium sp. CBA20B-1]|uniref:hypothetical protein n=2 Tax=unclassified Flavobacterium TaxID=196869 RepID=UPI0022252501|nr:MULTISPECIES: hypothetical protein [unclassified Flavobacterium]WCM41479.1 hypothetical protein MG290_11025 [Flavobacterium sp. CBA20B-1]